MAVLQTKVEAFFGKFAIYIAGALGAISIALGAGWYVSNLKLENEVAQREKIETQLAVSNTSYNSIKNNFMDLTKQLELNQQKGLESHALLQKRLAEIVESDKSRAAMETYLLSRPAETNCKTPKDITNAWSKL